MTIEHVWILEIRPEHGSWSVVGVYSSRQRAEEAGDKLTQFDYFDAVITKWTVNEGKE